MEVNFGVGGNVEKQKAKLKKMISQIDARMISRFAKGTFLPTLNIIASSKDTEQSFLESYIDTKKQNESKTTLIIDEPQWVIRNDKGTPNDPGSFYVAVGNKFLAHELLPVNAPDEMIEQYRAKGYYMLKVPPIYREAFEDNLDMALTDDAGISTASTTKYISGVRLNQAKVDTYRNPFTKDIIEVGDSPDDHLQYANFFDLSRVSQSDISRPLFIHLDMSTGSGGKGDKTGIAGVWITGKRPSQGDGDSSKELEFKLAFSVSIKAPKGFNISFEKNKNFIYWLKERGFAVKGISSDTFQSAAVLQSLKAAGFKTQICSVDRVDQKTHSCEPYAFLKSALYERHIKIYQKCDLLTEELANLERLTDGHIDHPNNGSKDQADALCLHPDTEVFLVSGQHRTIKQLYEEYKNNKLNEYILAYNIETENIEPIKIASVVNNGFKENLIKLTLDTGETLICTKDHKILTRNGKYIEAQDALNVSLMPFSIENKTMYKNGVYSYVYTPKYDGSTDGKYVHKLVAEYYHNIEKNEKTISKSSDEWLVIHHKDCNKLNNNPENLEYLTNTEHSQVHTALNSTEEKRNKLKEYNKKLWEANMHPFQKLSKEQKIENGRRSLTKLNKSDKHRKAVSDYNNKLIAKHMHIFQINKELGHTQSANAKRDTTCQALYGGTGFNSAKIQEKCRANCLANNGYDNPFHSAEKQYEMKLSKIKNCYKKIAAFYSLSSNESISLLDYKLACYILNISGVSSKPQDIINANIPVICEDFNKIEYERLRNIGNCVRTFIKDTNKLADTFTYQEFKDYYNRQSTNSKTFRHRFKKLPSYLDIVKLHFNLINHRVVKIEIAEGSEVYDLKLDKIHNFALTCGLFVHNCGATFTASQFAEEYSYSYGDNLAATLDMNEGASDEYMKRQMIADFQAELTRAYTEINAADQEKERQKRAEYQSYQDIADGIIVIG